MRVPRRAPRALTAHSPASPHLAAPLPHHRTHPQPTHAAPLQRSLPPARSTQAATAPSGSENGAVAIEEVPRPTSPRTRARNQTAGAPLAAAGGAADAADGPGGGGAADAKRRNARRKYGGAGSTAAEADVALGATASGLPPKPPSGAAAAAASGGGGGRGGRGRRSGGGGGSADSDSVMDAVVKVFCMHVGEWRHSVWGWGLGRGDYMRKANESVPSSRGKVGAGRGASIKRGAGCDGQGCGLDAAQAGARNCPPASHSQHRRVGFGATTIPFSLPPPPPLSPLPFRPLPPFAPGRPLATSIASVSTKAVFLPRRPLLPRAEPNFSLPWQRKRQYSSNSSGFLLPGRRILTNAHCVDHYTQVGGGERDKECVCVCVLKSTRKTLRVGQCMRCRIIVCVCVCVYIWVGVRVRLGCSLSSSPLVPTTGPPSLPTLPPALSLPPPLSLPPSCQVKVKRRGSDVKFMATVLSVGTECDIGERAVGVAVWGWGGLGVRDGAWRGVVLEAAALRVVQPAPLAALLCLLATAP